MHSYLVWTVYTIFGHNYEDSKQTDKDNAGVSLVTFGIALIETILTDNIRYHCILSLYVSSPFQTF